MAITSCSRVAGYFFHTPRIQTLYRLVEPDVDNFVKPECSLLSKLQEPISCFSVLSFIFLPVHRTPPLSASSYHNFRFLQANSPPSVFFRKECRSSPFYFSEIALVAVFPLHLTGICGMIQDVFLFLLAAAMPEGSPARRQGNGSNTHTFLLETERTRYIWDSLRKFSERTVSGS